MIIRNNLKSWLMIDDIGIKIPPVGKGSTNVDESDVKKSVILMHFIANGTVRVESGDGGILRKSLDGRTVYSIPSTDIWGKGGSVVNLADPEGETALERASLNPGNTRAKSASKRYKISAGSVKNVTLDSIGLAISKMCPSLILDEKQYHDECVQHAMSAGYIVLDEVFEETTGNDGQKEFVKIKEKSSGDPVDNLIANPGSVCAFWEGPMFDGGGYANMNRQITFHLDDMGHCIKPTLVSTLMDVEKDVADRIVGMSHNMIPLQSPKVYATNVPSQHCGRSIAYTMMETERKIHPLLAYRLKVADEIWVPCEWNKRVFEASGVSGDIKVMPLGVDHTTYHPDEQSVYFTGGTKGFTFLSVFNWNWRKGFDVLLKAYIRAFSDKDDVSLVMVSRYIGQKSLSSRIYADIEKCTSSERQEGRPHLALVDDVIPTFLMPKLYNTGDAFALFSRGEGWGLPYCEAASSGMPIVGANHGGQQMFLNDNNSLLLTPDQVVGVDKEIERISPFYHEMEFVSYSERAIDEAAEKMRWMYENSSKLPDMAERARDDILGQFTWKHAAERVADRLSEVQP